MKPLRLLVTYTAKPGQRDAFLRAERPDEILLIEEWASAEQQQTHLRQPHMQQLKQQKAQYIAETDVQTL